jgi:hypothetical protein
VYAQRNATTKKGLSINMDPEDDSSGNDEQTHKSEITVLTRFLSFLSYSKIPYGEDGWNNVLACDLWEQFKAWSKRNNFKLKLDAAQFAIELTAYSLNENSGLKKTRSDKQLFFSVNPELMNACLKHNDLLDADVW